jgi:hypothetical protein
VGSGPAATYGVMRLSRSTCRALCEYPKSVGFSRSCTQPRRPTPNVVVSLSHHLLRLKGSGPSVCSKPHTSQASTVL